LNDVYNLPIINGVGRKRQKEHALLKQPAYA